MDLLNKFIMNSTQILQAIYFNHNYNTKSQIYITSKSLNILIIVATLLLRHINEAFRTNSVHFGPFAPSSPP